jgi:hypothetical protein
MKKKNQIVIVGHTSEKLIYSIDKEVFDKLIFIIEEEQISGTKEAKRILERLINYYKERRVKVDFVKFNFNIQTKPIAQLVHLIYQQKFYGFSNITVNISGGLRYMSIWFYIACCITKTRIIHGDFIYEGNKEVGIKSNMELITIPLDDITDKQFEFLKLFFNEFNSYEEFFDINYSYNQNPLLNDLIQYDSIKNLRIALEKKRKENVSRGVINGFIDKLNRISALESFPNPDDNKEKSIKLTYMGIAYFLNKIFTKNT